MATQKPVGTNTEAIFKHPQRQHNRPCPPRHEDDGNLLRIGEILPGVLNTIEERRRQWSQRPSE